MRLRIIFLGGGGERGKKGGGKGEGRVGWERRGREGRREEREEGGRMGWGRRGREGGKEGSHTHIKESTSKMQILPTCLHGGPLSAASTSESRLDSHLRKGRHTPVY